VFKLAALPSLTLGHGLASMIVVVVGIVLSLNSFYSNIFLMYIQCQEPG
jgi:amino acid permease